MGSEDLFHKRKAKTDADLKRKKAFRSRKLRYLLICEGTKTEYNYFHELRKDLGIHTKQLSIPQNDGSSPDRIVNYALALYDDDASNGDPYDKVYCVFDRDSHSTFDASVQRIKNLKSAQKSKPFEAITSTPCFEFWLLLHFEYTDAAFHAAGKKSVGDKAVAALKKQAGFKTYDKGMLGIYSKLKNKLPVAIENAKKLRANSLRNKSANPATDVDILIQAIQYLTSNNK